MEIDGEAYWDGGYMGNPPLFPLIYKCGSADVIVVHINPIVRDNVPANARDILNRVNEITFNSSLMREMRAIAFATKLIDQGDVSNDALRRMLIHSIETNEMCDLGVESKLNPNWASLSRLRRIGQDTADAWFQEHFDSLNNESTVDIREKYL